MALRARYQTSPYVFSGNPIVLKSNGYPTDRIRGGRFSVFFERREIYQGRFDSPLDVDISEIALAAATPYRQPAFADGQPWDVVELTGAGARRLEINVDYNGQDREEYEMTALPGGLPAQQYRVYAESGHDAFESRFLGPGCNFFLTTRTSSWRICIKETELEPLWFIATGQLYSFTTPDGQFTLGWDIPEGICALDLDRLRRCFVETHGVLPSVFDVYTEDGGYCCRIVITHCEPARESYRIRFRNSFGVFDTLAIEGTLSMGVDFPDGEDTSYRRLDSVTRRYSTLRDRQAGRRVLEITTGLDHGYAELLADMLASDEVYLLDAFKGDVRVNVTADEVSFTHRQSEPERVALRMEMTEDDDRFGDFILGAGDSMRPRVHSKEFNKKFN